VHLRATDLMIDSLQKRPARKKTGGKKRAPACGKCTKCTKCSECSKCSHCSKNSSSPTSCGPTSSPWCPKCTTSSYDLAILRDELHRKIAALSRVA